MGENKEYMYVHDFVQEPGRDEPEKRSRYSDWLRTGRPRGRILRLGGGKNFDFHVSSRPALGPTQPPIEWVSGALSPGTKQPGREADNSPPTSAEVKKTWISIRLLPICLHAVVLN
jgi:hypothetical protein